jgi:hypothetical protein
MRRILIPLTVLAVAGMTATAAFAGNVHFLKKSPPTFTKSGLTLTAAGTIYGLGNGDVLVTLDASGTANTLCTNPGGSSKVPGQNPNFSASGSGSIPASNIINGHADFSVTTNPPASPVAGAPDCPNSSWTETITSITWTSATIRVYQPCTGPTPAGCPLVLEQTFSGSPFPL